MSDLTKDSILRTNNQQWSSSSKIEAEGLEWLYNDPTAQKTNEEKLESYLLGESIPGARGELQKTDELEGSTLGSLLRDESSNRVYEQTLNKFREDPLFVIKKLEMHQKQVRDKYSTIARNYDKKKRELSSRPDSEHRDRDRHRRDSHHDHTHRDHSDRRSHKHRRYEDRHRDSRRREHRSRNRSPERRDSRRRSSRSRSRSPEPETKKVKGPERPKKYNPLKYAFGVNEDISPPDAIVETARRKQLEAKAREQESYDSSRPEKDEKSLLEEMKQHGSSHIKEKIQNISKLDLMESILEKEESKPKVDYISKVKRDAFEGANMAEMIRRKASKQQDPFNERI